MGVKSTISVFIAGIIVYFIVVARITFYDILVSVIVSAIPAIILGEILVEKPSKIFSPARWAWSLVYALYYLFIVEPKCHLRVSAIILGLRKYSPRVVQVKYDYKTEYAMTAAANSITNTPGTLVVDVDPNRKVYHVHWLEAYSLDPRVVWKNILGSFDKWVKKIFED